MISKSREKKHRDATTFSLGFPLAWINLFKTCRKNRFLFRQVTQRTILATYKLSSLGAVWMIIKPLFTFLIYLVVFGLVFKVRWSTSEPDSLGFSFVLPLLIGVALHEFYASIMIDASSVLNENRNYIKKVAFPLEILPLALTIRTLLTFLIYLVIVIFAVIAIKGSAILIEFAFLIPILVIIIMSGTGIALMCSAFGLFFPDFKHLNEVLARILFFVAPIFYPLEQVPPKLQLVIGLNPLTQVIEVTRHALLWGKLPSSNALAALFFLSWLVLSCGYVIFQRCRRGFADVI